MADNSWDTKAQDAAETGTDGAPTEKSTEPEMQAEDGVQAAEATDAVAVEAGEEGAEPKQRRGAWREIRSWARDLVIAAVICLLLIVYVAQPFRVEKTSMEPLLSDGDRILVSKISLLLEPIRRGDVVVLYNPRNPDESWIKRVIALPGESVRIDEGRVYINGEPLEESYIPADRRLGRKNTYPSPSLAQLAREYDDLMEEFGLVLRFNPGHGRMAKVEQRVPKGFYFVLGDNRIYSMDSRDSIYSVDDPDHPEEGGPGLIPKRYIYGKALFRYWPLGKFGPISAASYDPTPRRR